MTRSRWVLVGGLLVLVVSMLLSLGTATFSRTLAVGAIYVILLSGLRIVTGLTRLISLAHFSIAGVGAYAAAVTALKLGRFGLEALAVGAAAGLVVSLFIAVMTVRLTADYYAFATLAAGEMLSNVFRSASDVTGGTNGLMAIPSVSGFGYQLDRPNEYLWFCLVIAFIGFLLMLRYERSLIGLAIQAEADEGGRVQALGVRPRILRVYSFAVGGLFAGVSGALVASTDHFVGPESFGVHQSIMLLCLLVLGGGLTSGMGVLVAAGFASFGLEMLRPLGAWQMVVVSAAAVVILSRQSKAAGNADVK